jgi:hypothetical protein
MIPGIDTGLTQDYVSKYDSSEPKTVWKIGVLSAHAFAYVGSRLSDPTKALDGMIEVVRFGLRGFSNFNKNGKEIQFQAQERTISSRDYQLVSDSIIEMIPVDVIIELGGKILEITKLSEQVIKN